MGEFTKRIKETTAAVMPEIVTFRRDMHAHPEESLKEFRTTERIAEELDRLGVSYRKTEPTGIIAEVKGTKGTSDVIVMLRGDIDALSITEETGLPFASENPGFMHACGHDTHISMLLGAVKVLNQMKDAFSGTVRFLFQPAEEVGKGADLMIAQGAMEGVKMGFGIHINSQLPTGVISTKPGPSMASADKFTITVKGKGSHGAMPEGGVDAVYVAAAITTQLQTLVSRETDPQKPLVVTVGSIQAGTRFNIISENAVMEGTCRCFDREVYETLPEKMERIAKYTAMALRAEATVTFERIVQPLNIDEGAYEILKAAGEEIAERADQVQMAVPTMGGEDFASYTALAPCAFAMLGAGGEYPLHNSHVVFQEESFHTGIELYAQFAVDALAKLGEQK